MSLRSRLYMWLTYTTLTQVAHALFGLKSSTKDAKWWRWLYDRNMCWILAEIRVTKKIDVTVALCNFVMCVLCHCILFIFARPSHDSFTFHLLDYFCSRLGIFNKRVNKLCELRWRQVLCFGFFIRLKNKVQA